MVLSPDAPILEPIGFWVLLAGVIVSLIALGRIAEKRVTTRLRQRFVLGVPWGTIIVILVLWWIFHSLQGGTNYGGPVVVGFRSWSYSYPTGMMLGAFSHGGKGHLIGNLVSTAAFAPVAEYAWSHYTTQRGSQSFAGWRTNPFVRIALFVVGVFLVGIATSFLIPGALIGFSGVVFAFAGLALVTRPILAVFALAGERVINILYFSLNDPLVTRIGRTQFVTPSWADVAVQGHLLGFVIGVLVGLWLVRKRDQWPDPGWVWGAAVVFGVAKTLYALYWYLGGTRYVLFRGVGTAMVFVLAAIVAGAFVAKDRELIPRISVSRRQAAAGILVATVLAIGLLAVPYNLATVTPGPETDTGVEIRDYTVSYAEDVPHRYIAAVDIPFFENAFQFNTSGVIVTSDRRNAWEVVVPAGRLAVNGRAVVPVGGPGWRDTVVVNRTGWKVVNGASTYRVFLRYEGERRQTFTADPVEVPAVINNSRIRIRPAEEGFALNVSRNETVIERAGVPQAGQNVTVADITFNRTGKTLRAIHDGTRITIARYQLDQRRDRNR
jgi:membrane associated rhomboid family serine protease